MILTPTCYYIGDVDNLDLPQCAFCGRRINYVHIMRSEDGQELEVGLCCARKHRERREPLRGRYDWRLSDVRKAAYYDWYSTSLARAK